MAVGAPVPVEWGEDVGFYQAGTEDSGAIPTAVSREEDRKPPCNRRDRDFQFLRLKFTTKPTCSFWNQAGIFRIVKNCCRAGTACPHSYLTNIKGAPVGQALRQNGPSTYFAGEDSLECGSQPGQFCLPGNIWQHLQVFLVLTTGRGGRMQLASSGQKPGVLHVQCPIRLGRAQHSKEPSTPVCPKGWGGHSEEGPGRWTSEGKLDTTGQSWRRVGTGKSVSNRGSQVQKGHVLGGLMDSSGSNFLFTPSSS